MHVIIYSSPKCLKRVEKVKKTDFFKKQGFRQSWTKVPPDSTAIFIFFCYFSVLSLLKECNVFEILLQFSLPQPYTKLKLGKKILDTGVQDVIFCRRTLHLRDRYPFSLLVKSARRQKCPAAAAYSLTKLRVMCNVVCPQGKTT